MQGRLIVFEGCDGAGKTTVAKRFVRELRAQGEEVVYSFEPTNDTDWGRRVREGIHSGKRLSPEQELEFLIEDRKVHVELVILPALEAGKIVVLDRYYFSTAAYQGIRGLNPENIILENEKFAPKPWIVFLLDVDGKAAKERMEGRSGHEPSKQQLIRHNFSSIAASRPDIFLVVPTSVMKLDLVSNFVSQLYASKKITLDHGG